MSGTSNLKDHEVEEKCPCPYDPAHMILQGRMMTHLDKCRESHHSLSKHKKRCRYNHQHIIPAPELDWHEKYCEYRNLNKDLKSVERARTMDLQLRNIPSRKKEDWDDTDPREQQQREGFRPPSVAGLGMVLRPKTGGQKRRDKRKFEERPMTQNQESWESDSVMSHSSRHSQQERTRSEARGRDRSYDQTSLRGFREDRSVSRERGRSVDSFGSTSRHSESMHVSRESSQYSRDGYRSTEQGAAAGGGQTPRMQENEEEEVWGNPPDPPRGRSRESSRDEKRVDRKVQDRGKLYQIPQRRTASAHTMDQNYSPKKQREARAGERGAAGFVRPQQMEQEPRPQQMEQEPRHPQQNKQETWPRQTEQEVYSENTPFIKVRDLSVLMETSRQVRVEKEDSTPMQIQQDLGAQYRPPINVHNMEHRVSRELNTPVPMMSASSLITSQLAPPSVAMGAQGVTLVSGGGPQQHPLLMTPQEQAVWKGYSHQMGPGMLYTSSSVAGGSISMSREMSTTPNMTGVQMQSEMLLQPGQGMRPPSALGCAVPTMSGAQMNPEMLLQPGQGMRPPSALGCAVPTMSGAQMQPEMLQPGQGMRPPSALGYAVPTMTNSAQVQLEMLSMSRGEGSASMSHEISTAPKMPVDAQIKQMLLSMGRGGGGLSAFNSTLPKIPGAPITEILQPMGRGMGAPSALGSAMPNLPGGAQVKSEILQPMGRGGGGFSAFGSAIPQEDSVQIGEYYPLSAGQVGGIPIMRRPPRPESSSGMVTPGEEEVAYLKTVKSSGYGRGLNFERIDVKPPIPGATSMQGVVGGNRPPSVMAQVTPIPPRPDSRMSTSDGVVFESRTILTGSFLSLGRGRGLLQDLKPEIIFPVPPGAVNPSQFPMGTLQEGGGIYTGAGDRPPSVMSQGHPMTSTIPSRPGSRMGGPDSEVMVTFQGRGGGLSRGQRAALWDVKPKIPTPGAEAPSGGQGGNAAAAAAAATPGDLPGGARPVPPSFFDDDWDPREYAGLGQQRGGATSKGQAAHGTW